MFCLANVTYPANTTHRSNVGPMLAHRLRRWSHIGPALDRCVVFATTPILDVQKFFRSQ